MGWPVRNIADRYGEYIDVLGHIEFTVVVVVGKISRWTGALRWG